MPGDDVVLVGGARPNFMKLAPILRELARRGEYRTTLVHTGQHDRYDMSGVFFEELGMQAPDVRLEIGTAAEGPQRTRIRRAFESHLATRAKPRAVLVVGDVSSTVACALAAARRRIPVIHVEAGLRSFDPRMPEEANRVITDSVSDLLLASEPAGVANLAREGASAHVRLCGNVMIDSLVSELPAARALDMPARLGVTSHAYAIATLHRPANVDDPARLQQLVGLLRRLARELPVLFVVHPRTENMLATRDELVQSGVELLPPLGYRQFLGAVASAAVVVTDSGGVQDETSFLGVPCVTLRSNTERPITITHGTNTLAGDDLDYAFHLCSSHLRDHRRKTGSIPGWDGRAAERIVDAVSAFLQVLPRETALVRTITCRPLRTHISN